MMSRASWPPLVIGQHPVLGCGSHNAMPHRPVDSARAEGRMGLAEQPVQPPEVPAAIQEPRPASSGLAIRATTGSGNGPPAARAPKTSQSSRRPTPAAVYAFASAPRPAPPHHKSGPRPPGTAWLPPTTPPCPPSQRSNARARTLRHLPDVAFTSRRRRAGLYHFGACPHGEGGQAWSPLTCYGRTRIALVTAYVPMLVCIKQLFSVRESPRCAVRPARPGTRSVREGC